MGVIAIIIIATALIYGGFYFSGWVMDEADKDFHKRIEADKKNLRTKYKQVCEVEGWRVDKEATTYEMRTAIERFQKLVRNRKSKTLC